MKQIFMFALRGVAAWVALVIVYSLMVIGHWLN